MQLTESEQRSLDIGHDGGDAVVLQGLCRRLLAEIEVLDKEKTSLEVTLLGMEFVEGMADEAEEGE